MEINVNGMFQYHNTAFRVHPSLCSDDNQIKTNSLSNSPNLKTENNSTKLTENETCRTIVSMLINQRKTNLNLEQQLKHLQSTNKATTSQSPTLLNSSSSDFNTNNDHNDKFYSNQSLNIKRFSLDEHQQRNFIYRNSQHHLLSKNKNKKKSNLLI